MITVSIVDDESQLRQSIVTFINGSQGFRCLNAYGSAEAALQGLVKERPDVVLMDICMEGINGIECVERLKEMMPELQIVMLTVYEDPDQIFAALAAGATGYMLKRQTPARLLEAIKEVHEGGSPMSHSIARKVVASFQKREQTGAEQGELLSPRELTVLDCLTKGLAYKQIADQLGITVPTIRSYLRRIYEKLHVQTRSEAVARYLNR
jgi:DNA-binding NarL/FixJ family response regulator